MNKPSLPYRKSVGMVILNSQNAIFMGKRGDVSGAAWQLPQGGIDEREDPEQALWREMKEELGTNQMKMLAQSEKWVSYDFPKDLLSNPWESQFRGQQQKWFLLRFVGKDLDICVQTTTHPEFQAWGWFSPAEVLSLCVPFKKYVYEQILKEFSSFLF